MGFGQTVCTPLRPRCGVCSVTEFCPSAFKETSSPNSKSKKSPSRKKLSWVKSKFPSLCVQFLSKKNSKDYYYYLEIGKTRAFGCQGSYYPSTFVNIAQRWFPSILVKEEIFKLVNGESFVVNSSLGVFILLWDLIYLVKYI